MRVKLLTTMAGPEGTFYPGNVIEATPTVAAALVKGGYGVLVDEPVAPDAPETAQAPEVEAPEDMTEEDLERATAPDAPETAQAPETRKGRKGR
jgi:hypothetical protein